MPTTYDFTKEIPNPSPRPIRLAQPDASTATFAQFQGPGYGLGQSTVNAYNTDTLVSIAQLRQAYEAQAGVAGAGTGAQRAGINDRLKFGLQGLGLDREQLGLERESLGLNQQSADLNRRDAIEGAINNALQRGIYRSGIRVRNVQRAGERADLVDQQLGLQGKGLDLQGKRIDLNEEELRASVKNALAALNAQAKAAKQANEAQMQLALFELEQQRRQQLDQTIMEYGGVFSDASYIVGGAEDPYSANLNYGGPQ